MIDYKPVFGIKGYPIQKWSSEVDLKLSTAMAKSRVARDEKQTAVNFQINLKKHVPAPNIYNITVEKP